MTAACARWRCTYCSHVYDEAVGDPEQGVPPGTPFADLPADWTCPDCGAAAYDFRRMED